MAKPPQGHSPAIRAFVIGLLAVVIGIAGAVFWEDYQKQFVYAVEVDGALLACVTTREEWRQALASTEAWAAERMGLPVALRSKVQLVKRRPDPGETPLAGQALLDACKANLNFVAVVWAISVDGKDVAYVRTEAEARQTLPSLVEDYSQSLLAKGNTVVTEVTVAQKVECHRVEAPVAEVGDVEQAKRILLRGTDRVLVHVVQKGESLWGIAKSNSLTVDDLRKANPGIKNTNVIRVGQEINLIVPDPYVTLRSKEKYTYIAYLPFAETVRQDPSKWPWESYVEKAGVRGRKEVTVEIVRENGDETSRRLLSEKLLSGPSAQSYVLGTKVYPQRAGGLVWPAPGRITSPYGWRRREFHHGMDIGAPYGASVLACKSGKVKFAGWRGGYGNLVIIDHGGGLESWYAHLSSVLVSVGQEVSRGACVGKVGSTGRSTGAHLHFEIHLDGESTNPVNYYPRGG